MIFYYIYDEKKDCYIRVMYAGSFNQSGTRLNVILPGGQERQISFKEIFHPDKRVYS